MGCRDARSIVYLPKCHFQVEEDASRLDVHSVNYPQLINQKELSDWAFLQESRGNLPTLIVRLIRMTGRSLSISILDFPDKELVSKPDFDGLLKVDDEIVDDKIPSGLSVWELKTSQESKVTSEANSDFQKRTDRQTEFSKQDSTFVFVTPQTWNGKRTWIDEKNKEGKWKEVRAYDAVDLLEWLALAPPVMMWLCHQLGKPNHGVKGIEQFWSELENCTSPKLKANVFTVGRDPAAEALNLFVKSLGNYTLLKTTSAQEGLHFLAAWAVLVAPPEERESIISRTLIIENMPSWRAY
ncbi:MAG: hypothetical protein AAF585_10545, partial [Verrucomicrobiota bacterium]